MPVALTPYSRLGRLPHMARFVRRYRWWLVGIGLLFSVAIAAWFGSRRMHPAPGSLQDVFARVRIGMSQRQAVAVLRTCNPDIIDFMHIVGTTQDGQVFSSFGLEDFSPKRAIELCELTIGDEQGREIEVAFGRGRTVTGKRFRSPNFWEAWPRNLQSPWSMSR